MIPVTLAIYVGFITLEQFEFVRRIIPVTVTNVLLLVGCLFLVYKLVPDRPVRTKSAFISALFTSGGIWATHNGYSYITVKMFNYNKIYGSFAAIPVLLIWLLSIWFVILAGVALCAGMHKRE
jgi:membrane protein